MGLFPVDLRMICLEIVILEHLGLDIRVNDRILVVWTACSVKMVFAIDDIFIVFLLFLYYNVHIYLNIMV